MSFEFFFGSEIFLFFRRCHNPQVLLFHRFFFPFLYANIYDDSDNKQISLFPSLLIPQNILLLLWFVPIIMA